MLGIIISIANFLSFLSGIVFGAFLTTAGVLYLLRDKEGDVVKKEEIGSKNNALKNKTPVPLPKEDADRLSTIIDILEDINSPLKNMSPILKRIHQNTIDSDLVTLDTKMRNIIDYQTISKIEKEFQDTIGELKDHYKQVKLLSSFLNDVSRYFQAFSKDLGKLSNSAKNNLLKQSASMESKQDIIVNNWWQMLMTAFDSLSNDHQDVAGLIGDELMNYSNQIQEEIVSIEKKLSADGGRHFAVLRDNVNLFEAKLKERDKNLEKLKSTQVPQGMTNKLDPGSPNSMNLDMSLHSTISGSGSGSSGSASTTAIETYQRRYIRYRTADDNLKTQTRRLYDIQKEFYLLLPRYTSDVQLTVIKSIVETQSQLSKLIDGFLKLQRFQHTITNKMQLSLTNAAGSFLQILKQENKLIQEQSFLRDSKEGLRESSPAEVVAGSIHTTPGKVYTSLAMEIMKTNLLSQGVKGYELTLQRVLEGLIVQSQIKDITHTVSPISKNTASSAVSGTVVIGGNTGHGVRYDSSGKEIALSANGTASSSSPVHTNTNTTTNTTGAGAGMMMNTLTGNTTGTTTGNNTGTTGNTNTGNTGNTSTGVTGTPSTVTGMSSSDWNGNGNGISEVELSGRLNMYTEPTACLAAHNPQILPYLPTSFTQQAIGIETCIWFNAFSGRVYRDMANSDYFYQWLCAKLSAMLNKTPENTGKDKLPDYVDKFEVSDVVFGDLPPLLLNMKWSPYRNKKKNAEKQFGQKTTFGVFAGSVSGGVSGSVSGGVSTGVSGEEEEDDDAIGEESSDSDGGEGDTDTTLPVPTTTSTTDSNGITTTTTCFTGKTSSGNTGTTTGTNTGNTTGNNTGNNASKKGKKKSSKSTKERSSTSPAQSPTNTSGSGTTSGGGVEEGDQQGDEESYYYAACTADMAFRSGIKFTVKTRLWINWPRDRYASVPILFHLDLAELSGRVKFGVKRSCSFFTFLEDPLIRINVRSEVGHAKYKLNDIPQMSEYIVRKLKSFIHKKVVYPHAHRFRLIWPRNWWPAGTEGLFMPAPTGGLPTRNQSNPNLVAMATTSDTTGNGNGNTGNSNGNTGNGNTGNGNGNTGTGNGNTSGNNGNGNTTSVTGNTASERKSSTDNTGNTTGNTSGNTGNEETATATATRKARTYSIIGATMATAFTGNTTGNTSTTNTGMDVSMKTPAKSVQEMSEDQTYSQTSLDKFHDHLMKVGILLPTSTTTTTTTQLQSLKRYYRNHLPTEYRHYADWYDYTLIRDTGNTTGTNTSTGTTTGNTGNAPGTVTGTAYRYYAYDDMLVGNRYAMIPVSSTDRHSLTGNTTGIHTGNLTGNQSRRHTTVSMRMARMHLGNTGNGNGNHTGNTASRNSGTTGNSTGITSGEDSGGPDRPPDTTPSSPSSPGLSPGLFPRHHSISDFRVLPLSHVLTQEYGKYVAMHTLTQSMKLSNPNTKNQNTNTKNHPNGSGSGSGNGTRGGGVRGKGKNGTGNGNGTGNDGNGNSGNGTGNEEKFSWFSKDGIQKAKAKFNEMKNKHFTGNATGTSGNGTSGSGNTGSGNGTFTGSGGNGITGNVVNTLSTNANKLGDKLSEMLFAEEGNNDNDTGNTTGTTTGTTASGNTGTSGMVMTGGSPASTTTTTTAVRRRGSEDTVLGTTAGGVVAGGNINHSGVTSSGTTRAVILTGTGNSHTGSGNTGITSGHTGSHPVQLERKDSLTSLFTASSVGTMDGRRRRNSLTGQQSEEDAAAGTGTSSGGSKVSAMKNMMANMFRSSNN